MLLREFCPAGGGLSCPVGVQMLQRFAPPLVGLLNQLTHSGFGRPDDSDPLVRRPLLPILTYTVYRI
jgi:hypothetical protein